MPSAPSKENAPAYFLSDHEGFNKKKLEHFANECRSKGAELLICTEKDKVKFTSPLNLSLPVAWLQIQLSIIEGNENWVTFIEKIKQDIIHKT